MKGGNARTRQMQSVKPIHNQMLQPTTYQNKGTDTPSYDSFPQPKSFELSIGNHCRSYKDTGLSPIKEESALNRQQHVVYSFNSQEKESAFQSINSTNSGEKIHTKNN